MKQHYRNHLVWPAVTYHDSWNSWKCAGQNSETQKMFERRNRTREAKCNKCAERWTHWLVYFSQVSCTNMSWVLNLRGRHLLVTGWLQSWDVTTACLQAGQPWLAFLCSRSIAGAVQLWHSKTEDRKANRYGSVWLGAAWSATGQTALDR